MKILLVDDHALFRAGLRLLLRAIRSDALILEASDIDAALTIAAREPDLQLCLLDLMLRNERGLDVLSRLRELAPEVAIVIVSASEEPQAVRQSIDAGAMSFIPKSATPEELSEALRQVLAGHVYLPSAVISHLSQVPAPQVSLTPRQTEVLNALSRGLVTKSIARELGLSEHTVKEYIGTLFQLLGVHNRTEAVVVASRLGLRSAAAGERLKS